MGPNNGVSEIVIQADGKILIAGEFTQVDGVGRTRLARLDSSGDLDPSYNVGVDATIRAMGLLSNGQLVIGGDFESVGGTSQYKLAVLQPVNGTPAIFSNPLATPSGGVISLAVQGDDKIIIGGEFVIAGDVNTSRLDLARIDGNGNVDLTFAKVDIGVGRVNSVSVQSDDRVLISGWFSTVNGTDRTGIARLESNGSLDTSFFDAQTGAGANATLNVFARSNGKVLVQGSMLSFSGVDTPGDFIQLNANGTVDTTFTSSDPLFLEPSEAHVLNEHGMLLSHEVPATGINLSGELVLRRSNSTEEKFTSPLEFLPAINDQVDSVAVQNDGRIVIGGIFDDVQGTSMTGFARLNSNGRRDETFVDALSDRDRPDFLVNIQGDGKTLVTGSYFLEGSGYRNYVVRVNSDGSRDLGFNSGVSAFWNGVIKTVEIQPDGSILYGGLFNEFAGELRKNIARVLADGTLDEGFMNGLAGPDGTVVDIAIQLDGKVVIVGGFTQVNGVPRNRIARLNSDGSLDETFQNGMSGADATVNTIAIQSNDKILVGGLFTSVNGTSRGRVARLETNGAIDPNFMNGVAGANDTVRAVAIKSDGKIVIGGNFTEVDGTSRTRLAQLNSDGSLDSAFMNGQSGFDFTVQDIAIDADGDVLASGAFSHVHETPISFIARLDGAGTGGAVLPSIVQQPMDLDTDLNVSGSISVVATGTGPLSYQWKKGGVNVEDGSDISGATTAVLRFANIEPDNGGDYSVMIANSKGSVTSATAQLIVPMPPVAINDLMERESGQDGTVLIADILANDFNLAGGGVSYISVSPFTSNFASVTDDGTTITYSGFSDVTDSFTYEIENAEGARTTGTVTVIVRDPTHTAAPTFTTGTLLFNNMVQLDLQGVPNRNYLIQSADSLSEPNWVTIGTETADESGVISFVSPGQAGAEGYFRITPVL